MIKDQKNIIKRKQAGTKSFTLVETLMAVAVLMIAIAGPLVVANDGLVAALYAKDQSVATLLAQEGMEMVRNVKDQAIYTNQTSGFGNLFFTDPTLLVPPMPSGSVSNNTLYNCLASRSANNPCGVDFQYQSWNGSYIIMPYLCNLYPPSSSSHQCQMILNPNGDFAYGQWHSSSDARSKAIFQRSFSWVPIGASNNEIQVTVTVTWNEGTVNNTVSVVEEMTGTVL